MQPGPGSLPLRNSIETAVVAGQILRRQRWHVRQVAVESLFHGCSKSRHLLRQIFGLRCGTHTRTVCQMDTKACSCSSASEQKWSHLGQLVRQIGRLLFPGAFAGTGCRLVRRPGGWERTAVAAVAVTFLGVWHRLLEVARLLVDVVREGSTLGFLLALRAALCCTARWLVSDGDSARAASPCGHIEIARIASASAGLVHRREGQRQGQPSLHCGFWPNVCTPRPSSSAAAGAAAIFLVFI
eukprot:COSAG03_NODE_282_length_9474_cov_2.398720_12_plen_241_part_00